MSCPSCNDSSHAHLYKCNSCGNYYCEECESTSSMFNGKRCPHCSNTWASFEGYTKDFK